MKKTKLTIKTPKPWKVAKGHHQHRGGAGTHADRRMSRLKTRATQRRAAMSDE